MLQSTSSNPSTPTIPLLTPTPTTTDNDHRSLRRQSLIEASRFLRRATTTRRTLSSPSITVRETAAQQIEDRQTDWAYSRPVVILDVFWNILFVAVAVAVLVASKDEEPATPLRLWILGYAVQCVVHVVCVCVEYRRRCRPLDNETVSYVRLLELTSSVVKNMESANTMFSFVWWIMGFYWVSPDGQELIQHSPKLYWLCVAFLAFDVFFVLVCIALACVIGIAVCCCLPCIIAVLYAVADQEGATKEDIDQLLKYKFRRFDLEKPNGEFQGASGGVMTECGTDSPIEHVVSPEDAECCICLCAYDDGAELRELPCGHHFHCACIDKWLHINATCPLCKYNILKRSSSDLEAV